jgi:fructose-1-phosphate kinase PfkB-like protein
LYFVEILDYKIFAFSYVYSGSLPSGVTESMVRELMAALSSKPKLAPLIDICRAFIGSYDLKQRE